MKYRRTHRVKEGWMSSLTFWVFYNTGYIVIVGERELIGVSREVAVKSSSAQFLFGISNS